MKKLGIFFFLPGTGVRLNVFWGPLDEGGMKPSPTLDNAWQESLSGPSGSQHRPALHSGTRKILSLLLADLEGL